MNAIRKGIRFFGWILAVVALLAGLNAFLYGLCYPPAPNIGPLILGIVLIPGSLWAIRELRRAGKADSTASRARKRLDDRQPAASQKEPPDRRASKKGMPKERRRWP